MSPTRTRTKELDEACAAAVDLAMAAATDVAGPGQVGEHAGMQSDGDRVVTHLFACLDPAYAGWRWAVTVARASRATSRVMTRILSCGTSSIAAKSCRGRPTLPPPA